MLLPGLWNRDDHTTQEWFDWSIRWFGNLIMTHNIYVLSLVLGFDCLPPLFLCVLFPFCLSFFLWFSCFLPFFFLFFPFLSFLLLSFCFISCSLPVSLQRTPLLMHSNQGSQQRFNMTTWKITPQWHSLREKKKIKATLSRVEIPHTIADSRLITGADRDTLEDPPSGIRGKDLSNQEPHVLQWDVEMLRCWFW